MSERIRQMTSEEAKAHLNTMFPGNEDSNSSFWTRLLDNSLPNDELGRTALLHLSLGRFGSRVFQSSIYVLAKRAIGELTTPEGSSADGSEEIESNFYREALSIWKKFVIESYPPSRSRPEVQGDYWKLILNNALPTEEVMRNINAAEHLGGIHLTSTTYQACKRLLVLREIGIFPIPNIREDEDRSIS